MKKLLNIFLLATTAACIFFSCKKDEEQAVLNLSGSPVLSTSSAALVLDSVNAATKTALTLTWSAMPTRVQVPVTYTLQIDTNATFSKPVNVSLATGLLKTYTV